MAETLHAQDHQHEGFGNPQSWIRGPFFFFKWNFFIYLTA